MEKKNAHNSPKTGSTGDTTPPRKTRPHISRDVGLQSKGARLQRLRAVLLLIEATATYPRTNAFAAVEFQGDVFVSTADASASDEYVEENKNYAPAVSFTMNSNEVLNSLVAFCDLWISKGCSKHVRFGFYTPNAFTSENNTERTKGLGIEWPDKAMLELLSTGTVGHPNVLEAAKRSVIGEYEDQSRQHGHPASNGPTSRALANVGMIQSWSDGQWKEFLGQIEWKFGQSDADTIRQTIVDAIQRSPAYNEQLAGKEEQIISILMDLIDERQAIPDPTQRFVHVAEVILAFTEVQTGAVKLPDPTWQIWKQLPKPTDTRNIEDKVTAYCPEVAAKTLLRMSRRAAQSMVEQDELGDDKQLLSLKYQLYDACEERLSELRGASKGGDEHQLDVLMKDLLATATDRFAQCSLQYQYKLKSQPSIQAIVYELLDSCYLSFDGGVVQ